MSGVGQSLSFAAKRLARFICGSLLVAVLFLGVASAISKGQDNCQTLRGHEYCLPSLTWR
jgi:hypothetical protein